MFPNPDSQILFSNPISIKEIVSSSCIKGVAKNDAEYDFYYIYNALVDKPENESIEYKSFDLKNIEENTHKLESTIVGMLNK